MVKHSLSLLLLVKSPFCFFTTKDTNSQGLFTCFQCNIWMKGQLNTLVRTCPEYPVTFYLISLLFFTVLRSVMINAEFGPILYTNQFHSVFQDNKKKSRRESQKRLVKQSGFRIVQQPEIMSWIETKFSTVGTGLSCPLHKMLLLGDKETLMNDMRRDLQGKGGTGTNFQFSLDPTLGFQYKVIFSKVQKRIIAHA